MMKSDNPTGLFAYMIIVIAALIALLIWLISISPLPIQPANATPLLLGMVLVIGALGAQLQALLSLADYVGNQKYEPSWTFYYFKRPFVGAVVALLVFSTLNGGVIKGEDAAKIIGSFWGMTSICLISGLFSRQAMDKMGQVFSVMFAADVKRENPLNDAKTTPPVLTKLTPESVPHGAAAEISLTGTGFDSTCKVRVKGVLKDCTHVSDKELKLSLAATDLATAGTLDIAVALGGKPDAASKPLTLKII